jgi:hypothetical protein
MMVNRNEELQRLCRQLKVVTAERDRLLAEVHRLHHGQAMGDEELEQASLPLTSTSSGSLPATTKAATDFSAINNESPLPDRLRLFRSLFRGREDVFAKLWQSRKSQKVGYSPVCRHEWNSALCGKSGSFSRCFVPYARGFGLLKSNTEP